MTAEERAELVRLHAAAVALGDKLVPPVGTKVRVRTHRVGSTPADLDFESFFEGTVAPVCTETKVRIVIDRAGDESLPTPTVLEADPADVRIVELPADCLPFEAWFRLEPINPAAPLRFSFKGTEWPG